MSQHRLACALIASACVVLADIAFAQGGPFGVGGGAAAHAVAPGGLVGWIIAEQAAFYRALAGLLRAAKADGSATWGLLGISFLYGIFHAAGPGHGKAVISSYLVANDETWRRGLVLSFASALVQSLTAIALVGIAAALLGATAQAMGQTVRWIEIASYALIALLGARLLWTKGRAFVAALAALRPRVPALAAAVAGAHAEHHHAFATDGHDHDHDHHGHHHHHGHAHAHDADCGHMHGPDPAELAGKGGWRRGFAAVLAVGLRPCSGAIIVLVFALAQGLFWTGVAATLLMGVGTAATVAAIATLAVGAKGLAQRLAAPRPGAGTLAVRALEVAAAALVLAFGLLLLAGYMASERLMLA
jgi:ABC-type nickel/cobalt efflux system permease component RcnA